MILDVLTLLRLTSMAKLVCMMLKLSLYARRVREKVITLVGLEQICRSNWMLILCMLTLKQEMFKS